MSQTSQSTTSAVDTCVPEPVLEQQCFGNAAAGSELEQDCAPPPSDCPTLDLWGAGEDLDIPSWIEDPSSFEPGECGLPWQEPEVTDEALTDELLEQWRLERDEAAVQAQLEPLSERWNDPEAGEPLWVTDPELALDAYETPTEGPGGTEFVGDVAAAAPPFVLGFSRAAVARVSPEQVDAILLKLGRGGATAATSGLPEFLWSLGQSIANDIRETAEMFLEIPLILEAVEELLASLRGPGGAELAFALGVDMGLSTAGELVSLLDMTESEVAVWLGDKLGPLFTDAVVSVVFAGVATVGVCSVKVLQKMLPELKALAQLARRAKRGLPDLDGPSVVGDRLVTAGPGIDGVAIPDAPSPTSGPRDPELLDAIMGRDGEGPVMRSDDGPDLGRGRGPSEDAPTRVDADSQSPERSSTLDDAPLSPELSRLEGETWSPDMAEVLKDQGYVVYTRADDTIVVRRKDIRSQEALSVQDGRLQRGLRSGSDSPLVPRGTPIGEALTTLRGKSASWAQYEKMLTEHFGLGESDITRAMTDILGGDSVQADVDLDFLRHEMKHRFQAHVLDELDKLSPQESHRKLLEATRRIDGEDQLNPADKGSLAELWYQRTYMRDPETADLIGTRHPKLAKSDGMLKDRFPDLVDGNTLHEVKSGAGELSDADLEQFQDYMDAATKPTGGAVRKGGEPLREPVRKVVYTFTDPDGARANIDTIEDWLGRYGELTVEVFDDSGHRQLLTRDDLSGLSRLGTP